MGGNITPIVTRELDKHHEGANMQDLLMHSSYIGGDFELEGNPQFLARIFEAQDDGSLSVESAISVCEDIARVNGPNVAPQIGNIMSIIINCLMSNSECISLYQACSKVVVSVMRYAIDPLTPAEKKEDIIDSICRPLSDSLLCSKGISYGAALCLQALLDSDNWEYASNEIANEICVKVYGALKEETTQTDAHMGLVMALAKKNSLIIGAYARLLIRTGLRILRIGLMDDDSSKQLSAIQMVNFLMKCVDRRIISSEHENVTKEMEVYADVDQLPSVKQAAFEARNIVSAILCNACSVAENDSGSETCSNIIESSSSGSRFGYASHRGKTTRRATPIPERQRSRSNIKGIDIFTTPRKSTITARDTHDVKWNFSMKPTRKTRSQASRRLEPFLAREVDGSCRKSKFDNDRIPENLKRIPGSKSVLSIDDVASNVVGQDVHSVDPHLNGEIHSPNARDETFIKSLFNPFCYLLLIVSILTLLVKWFDGQEADVAPT